MERKIIKCPKCGKTVSLDNNGNTGKCFNCGIIVHALSPWISILRPCTLTVGRDQWYTRIWKWLRYRFRPKSTVKVTITGLPTDRICPASVWDHDALSQIQKDIRRDIDNEIINDGVGVIEPTEQGKKDMFDGLVAMYREEDERKES